MGNAGKPAETWIGLRRQRLIGAMRLRGATPETNTPTELTPERDSIDIGGGFAFESAVRCQPDTREVGYYLNNGDDWPDQVSAPNISARALFAVVSRFAIVYKSAISQPSDDRGGGD
jgi:hypothetical protein